MKGRAMTVILAAALLVLSVISLFVGVIDITPASLLSKDAQQIEVFLASRLPRLLAIFVLVCDMIGRVVIAPYELPIELVIGILGSIIFIVMLLYRLNHGRKAIRLQPAGKGGSRE